MKIPNLINFERGLKNTRERLLLQIDNIDKMLKVIEDLKKDTGGRCIKCFSRDLRIMKNGKYFCRACGYDGNRNEEKEK